MAKPAEESVPLPRAARTAAYSLYHPDPGRDAHWLWLLQEFGSAAVRDALEPLARVLKLARGQQCRSIVVEERYVDIDWRSEYSLFWSRRFEDRPAVAKRLHFFGDMLSPDQVHDVPAGADYIGYSVLRPATLGPVGRTILRPPPPPEILPSAVLCTVVDRPSLFGRPLQVRGVPFCQQDGELLRCAHAAAWICHYVAQERSLIGRRTTADIARLPSSDNSKHRPLPSNGLSGEQLQSIFSAIGIPAFFYAVDDLPDPPADLPSMGEAERRGRFGWSRRRRATKQGDHQRQWEHDMQRERVLRIACKYLNSGFPVVVLTEGEENHAFTLVGWERRDDNQVQLYASDDQVGPYEKIRDVLDDPRAGGKWVGIMVPLPEKVFLSGEAAEQAAWNTAVGAAELADDVQGKDFAAFKGQLEHLRAGVSIRARLMEGRELKASAGRQGRHSDGLKLYRLAHLPHWVWLVEFHDAAVRATGQPCVLAEIIFDSTSHDEAPITLLSSTKSISKDHGALRRGEAMTVEAPGPDRLWESLIVTVAADDVVEPQAAA